jgi:5-methylcytosine-specific restriction protein A
MTDERYCEQHKDMVRKQYGRDADRRRGSAYQRGYDGDWKEYRLRYLAEHPLCVICEREGRLSPASVVDHIKPHRGDMKLFWDPKNHQALCKMHHDRKTARGE